MLQENFIISNVIFTRQAIFSTWYIGKSSLKQDHSFLPPNRQRQSTEGTYIYIYTHVINLIYRECRSWDLSSIRQSESELWWLWLTQVCRHTYHQTSDCVYRPPEYRPITARRPFAALRSSTRPGLSHAQGSYFSLILNVKLKDRFPSILWIVVNGGSW